MHNWPKIHAKVAQQPGFNSLCVSIEGIHYLQYLYHTLSGFKPTARRQHWHQWHSVLVQQPNRWTWQDAACPMDQDPSAHQGCGKTYLWPLRLWRGRQWHTFENLRHSSQGQWKAKGWQTIYKGADVGDRCTTAPVVRQLQSPPLQTFVLTYLVSKKISKFHTFGPF